MYTTKHKPYTGGGQEKRTTSLQKDLVHKSKQNWFTFVDIAWIKVNDRQIVTGRVCQISETNQKMRNEIPAKWNYIDPSQVKSYVYPNNVTLCVTEYKCPKHSPDSEREIYSNCQ